MGPKLGHWKFAIVAACTFTLVTTFFILTEASFSEQLLNFKSPKPHGSPVSTKLWVIPKEVNHANTNSQLNPTNAELLGIASPWSLPPFESISPLPLPEHSPSFCANPPFPPQSPSTRLPPPTTHTLSPPPPCTPNFPIPSPPNHFASPPTYPKPPHYHPSPPTFYWPSPPKHVPSPPVVNPPPAVPPPPHKKPQYAVWCVAKPTVPDAIIQEALDYACGSGADCKSIQPNGPCFQPNTLIAHASYAFNSYWQNSKAAGGTCDFGGTAMLVTVDPSFNSCYFIAN